VKRTSAHRHSSRPFGVVTAVLIVATLYFARVVFIPLALALLLTVLTPAIVFLERIKLPLKMMAGHAFFTTLGQAVQHINFRLHENMITTPKS